MSDEMIKMTAFVSVECEARKLGDLRELIEWCNKYEVSDDCGLDWGAGKLYVELTGDKSVPAEWIECGDHIYPVVKYDYLVPTHEHPEYEKYNGPETYEEAREEALEKKPAKFDWPAWDRYADERRPE